MTTQEQADQHQAEVAALTAVSALAVREWFAQLRAAGITTLAEVRLALMEMLPGLVTAFGSAAATVAADWYEEVRASSSAGGSFVPRLPGAPSSERTDAMAGWATTPPAWLRSSLERTGLTSHVDLLVPDARAADSTGGAPDLLPPRPDLTITADRVREAGALGDRLRPESSNEVASDFTWVQDRIIAGTQRVVSDQARETVIASSLADRQARGWKRLSSGGGDCAFCALLIGRGAVYRASSVKFGAHDHCDCVAAPVFADESVGQPISVNDYKPSGRSVTDADRARVRAWMKVNGLT